MDKVTARLYRRKNSVMWYYAIEVPYEFRHLSDEQPKIRRSTNTTNKREAESIMHAAAAQFLLKIHSHGGKRNLTPSKKDTLLTLLGSRLRYEYERESATGKFWRPEAQQEKIKWCEELQEVFAATTRSRGHDPGAAHRIGLLVYDYTETWINDWPDQDPLLPDFCMSVVELIQPILNAIQKQMQGEFVKLPVVAPETKHIREQAKTYTLGDVFTRWANGCGNQKTIDTRKNQLKSFADFASKKQGKLPLEGYTRDHAGSYKAALLDGTYQPFGKPLSPRSVENYLTGIKAIFNFALQNGMLEKSPFANISSPERVSVIKAEITKALTVEQLKVMFATGTPFHTPQKPAHLLPLLALFTGGRLQELCQLEKEDFKLINGRWWIAIKEDADESEGESQRHVKNDYSIREVPLHKIIVATGLLDWIQKEAPDKGNVWGLKPNKYNGLGQSVSKHWTRWCLEKEVPGRFHRIRHTFAHYCRESHVPSETREKLMGHGAIIIATQGYGAGGQYPRHLLLEAIDSYDVIDVDNKQRLDVSGIKLKS